MRCTLLFCLNLLLTAATAQPSSGLDARLLRWRAQLPTLGPEAVLDSCVGAFAGAATPVQTAALHSLQGTALRMAGRLAEALAAHRLALRLRLRYLGARHEETANSYQNIANCYINLDAVAQAREYYLRSLAIKNTLFKADDVQMIPLYHNLGNCFQRDQNTGRAVFYLTRALQAGEKAYGPDSPRLLETLGYLGAAWSAPAPEKALVPLRRAIRIGEQVRDTAALALLYNNLGVALLSQGAYPEARAAFDQSIRLYSALPHPDLVEYGNCLQNKGSALLRLRDADGALQAFNAARPFFSRESDQAALLQNMGLAYRYRGEAAYAIDLLNEALNLLPATAPAALRAGILLNLGDAYLDLRQAGSAAAALYYFEQALSVARGAFVARCWNKIGLAHLENSQYDAAEAAFQRALSAQPEPAVAFALWINRARLAERLTRLDRMRDCLQAAAAVLHTANAPERYPYEQTSLQVAQATLMYRIAGQSNRASDWLATLEKALPAIKLVEGLKQYQQEEAAFWAVRNDFYDAYGVAVAALCALGRQEEAFGMTERAKGYFFKRLTGKELPAQNPSLPTLPEVQALLQPNQVMPVYHWSLDRIFAFVIRRNRMSVVSIPVDTALTGQLTQFFAVCTKPPDQLPDRQQEPAYRRMVELGHVLYRHIVAPLNLQPGEDLLIAPDGGLHYLPFEALMTAPVPAAQAARCRNHPYLVRQHTVGYVHSAAVFVALRRRPSSTASKRLLVMAPDFTHSRQGLRPLLHNQAEGKTVADIGKGDLWLGNQALKNTFIWEAPQYRILYLATHGEAFDRAPERSFLAFSEPADSTEPSLLRVQDMDTLHLDAELGVLSACRTAIGRLYRGEGFLSITRTMQEIGIRSTIASLWNVDDQQSPKLMRLLMQGLAKGASKPQALAQAKCAYLDEASHIKAHPFYWAGLLSSGDERPLSAGDGKIWLYGCIIAGIALFFLTGYVIRGRMLQSIRK